MNKAELVTAVSEKTGDPKKDVDKVVRDCYKITYTQLFLRQYSIIPFSVEVAPSYV